MEGIGDASKKKNGGWLEPASPESGEANAGLLCMDHSGDVPRDVNNGSVRQANGGW